MIAPTSCTTKPIDHTLVESGEPTSQLQPGEDWIGQDGYLSYFIDAERLLTESVTNEPFGRVMMDGSGNGSYLKVYDWILTGKLITPEECYSRERLLARAQTSVNMRANEVKNDPNRPIYHLQPPANWNNDPNGTL